MLNFRRQLFKDIDFLMVLLMCALISIGILAISSATSFSGDTTTLYKQILFFVIGFILMVSITLFD